MHGCMQDGGRGCERWSYHVVRMEDSIIQKFKFSYCIFNKFINDYEAVKVNAV